MFSRILMTHLHNQSSVRSYFTFTPIWTRINAHTSAPFVKNAILANASGFATSSRHDGKHQFVQYCDPPHEDHDYKNMRMKRPMSPHMFIYAPTEPAMTSIAQRGAGALLSFYAFALGAGSLLLPNGIESYVYMFQSLNLGFLSILILKILLGAPFCFHYSNGIRFCIWNLAKMFSPKELKSSAQKVYIATAALTFLFAII